MVGWHVWNSIFLRPGIRGFAQRILVAVRFVREARRSLEIGEIDGKPFRGEGVNTVADVCRIAACNKMMICKTLDQEAIAGLRDIDVYELMDKSNHSINVVMVCKFWI